MFYSGSRSSLPSKKANYLRNVVIVTCYYIVIGQDLAPETNETPFRIFAYNDR